MPLLNYKVVAEARKRFTFDPTPQQRAAAASYAKTAKSSKFAQQKETAVRGLFTEKVLGEILGYTPIVSFDEGLAKTEGPLEAEEIALGHLVVGEKRAVLGQCAARRRGKRVLRSLAWPAPRLRGDKRCGP